ncbi:peptidoglycan DD-metalloendopeptidase family protein [Bizionia myxarmorum]|uniref:Peptidoglycan DD-metalloendopeptidase family protein n=1 Tax=Bizionia myxarmorum TaxID=291186 RepID=A0A5D0R637_9FLAO|nr:peptidoglycan DD-metalloendopeptidase family protein [Bizionia myxarmorum]TYB76977.1 peptidoglycan DD-metalloendopeptidase family protein [Bizionia myxarmorum]
MNSIKFASFLQTISVSPLYVLDGEIPLSDYVAIDLSLGNTELDTFNIASSQAWSIFMERYCKQYHAQVAYGGYNEARNIYKRSSYFNQSDLETERNIHLGLDLWISAGTAIYAPLDGIIHSFANNANFGDYGPTIILEHHIQDITFYTLYGHLSLDSISNLKLGDVVFQNSCFARLGDSYVNGDYAPHLHFQIIRDIEGFRGDYPGVCNKKDLDKFLQNCPDPNLILKLK